MVDLLERLLTENNDIGDDHISKIDAIVNIAFEVMRFDMGLSKKELLPDSERWTALRRECGELLERASARPPSM